MAQGQPVGAQGVLEVGAEGARADQRGARGLVDLDHAAQASQVDRDHPAVAVADARLNPADHTGAAAVGNRRQPPLGAELEHAAHVLLLARASDHVRGAVVATAEGADDVAVGLAHRMAHPLAGLGAEQAVEGLGRAQARGRELDRLVRDRHLDPLAAEAEPLAHLRGERLQRRPVERPLGVAPAPPAAPSALAAPCCRPVAHFPPEPRRHARRASPDDGLDPICGVGGAPSVPASW